MSTVIGTVTLDRDMIFENEYNYSLVNSSVVETIGGGVNIQEFVAVESGRLITLTSTETQGMQLKSTVDSLIILTNVANTQYTLTITSNSKTFTKTVRFRNEIGGGGVQFEPHQVRDGLHSDNIYYKGKIYLMVI